MSGPATKNKQLQSMMKISLSQINKVWLDILAMIHDMKSLLWVLKKYDSTKQQKYATACDQLITLLACHDAPTSKGARHAYIIPSNCNY